MLATKNNLADQCKALLLQEKADLLNRLKTTRHDFYSQDFGRDEIDQSSMAVSEFNFMQSYDRMRRHLIEIEAALQRVQDGSFGICEETSEPIEEARLLAMPWTRLSVEGAELRETRQPRRA